MKKLTFHVIPNAHLDPVWLWDCREGLNEGVALFRAMLQLLEVNTDLIVIRGEAAIYEHVRRSDPATFDRVKKKIGEGRWNVVGGTWIQSDANLVCAEVLCRTYEAGLRYFREVLGVRVKTGWQPDCFGHTAGLPEVLGAAGMQNYAFLRPGPEGGLKLRTPAFWWRGRSGARILAYRPPVGGYNSDRAGIPHRFDQLLSCSESGHSTLRNVAMFIGLGNHGGGPTQRMVNEVRQWAASHPEHEVRFAGLDSFFAALRRELAAANAPKIDEVEGELNYCMRGCYASVARFKHAYRFAEHEMLRAERTATLLKRTGMAPAQDLSVPWQSLLFNSFHDILPGTSIERAFDEQTDEVAGARHSAREAVFRSQVNLMARVRIALPAVAYDHPKAVPFLIWNAHLRPINTFVEVEACLDSQVIARYFGRADELPVEVRVSGRPAAFQVIATEHERLDEHAWRKRVLVPVSLPSAGWTLATLGWVEGAVGPSYPATAGASGQTEIRNEFYRVSARPGAHGIQVQHRGRDLFGSQGLQLATIGDKWGSWGSMQELPESFRLTHQVDQWRISRVGVTESGPLRASLIVRFVAKRARVDLTLRLTAGVEETAIEIRVFSDLDAARIMLVLPGARSVQCEVPAEHVKRAAAGEIPVLRWLRARDGNRGFAIASDVLSAYNLEAGNLRVTLVRATRYACVGASDDSREWWRPTVDRGELRERMVLRPLTADIENTADLLTQPPIVTMAWENLAGTLPATCSLAALTPSDVRLLAFKPGPGGQGLDLRVQNLTRQPKYPALRLEKRIYRLGRILPGEVATFRLSAKGAGRPLRVALGR